MEINALNRLSKERPVRSTKDEGDEEVEEVVVANEGLLVPLRHHPNLETLPLLR